MKNQLNNARRVGSYRRAPHKPECPTWSYNGARQLPPPFTAILDGHPTIELQPGMHLAGPVGGGGDRALCYIRQGILGVYRDDDAEASIAQFAAGRLLPVETAMALRLRALVPSQVVIVSGTAVQSLLVSSKVFSFLVTNILHDTLAEACEALVAYHRRVDELKQAGSVDAVTGLHNRNFMNETFERQLERSRLARTPVSMIMLDIDDFKRVNDTYGHMVGDGVLRSCAASLREHLRSRDLLARYGGDEFCVLLPDMQTAETARTAARLITAVARAHLQTSGRELPSFTISVGIAEAHDYSLTTMLREADSALYRAKSEGKNRLAVHCHA